MVSSVFRPFSLRGAVRRLRAKFAIFNYLLEQMEFVVEWAGLLHGALVHQLTGQTPSRAHLALVNLFTMSKGRANDSLARMLFILHPPYHLPRRSGVLGDLKDEDFARIQAQLEADGYYVFEGCLSEDFCERIVQQSLKADCLVWGDEMALRPERVRAHYERHAAQAPKYVLTEDDTTDIPEIQQLLCDESLIRVAQDYLRSKPI